MENRQSDSAKYANFIDFNNVFSFPLKNLTPFDTRSFQLKRRNNRGSNGVKLLSQNEKTVLKPMKYTHFADSDWVFSILRVATSQYYCRGVIKSDFSNYHELSSFSLLEKRQPKW